MNLCLKVASKFSIAFTIDFLNGKSGLRPNRELEAFVRPPLGGNLRPPAMRVEHFTGVGDETREELRGLSAAFVENLRQARKRRVERCTPSICAACLPIA